MKTYTIRVSEETGAVRLETDGSVVVGFGPYSRTIHALEALLSPRGLEVETWPDEIVTGEINEEDDHYAEE